MDDERLYRLSEQIQALLEEQKKGDKKARQPDNPGAASDLFETYSQWRYEHPVKAMFVRMGGGVCASFLVLLLLWWLAGTGVGEATGMQMVRSKVTNVYYAVLWSTRGDADSGSPGVMTPQRFPGTIERVIDGVMVVSYYEGGKQYRRLVKPANVIVTDNQGLADWGKKYLLKGITIDFYIPLEEIKGHKVWAAVIWYRRVPVNVEIVESGLGYPEKNPPTAVVNQVFSQHYWNLARGK